MSKQDEAMHWAEGLIRQLPATHDGRNSWLLNHGTVWPAPKPLEYEPKQDDAPPDDGSEDGGDWMFGDYDPTGPEAGAGFRRKQDDARDSTVGAEPLLDALTKIGGLATATIIRADGIPRPFAWDYLGAFGLISASLASARADGIREASKAANEVHEYYAGVRDRTPTGTPAHYVMQECVIASARTWRAVAALLPGQPAAIRALINKDAGEV